MKKIKRTTIKIRRRELIVVGRGEEIGTELVQRCPACHFPLLEQKSFPVEVKTPLQLLESNKDFRK